MIDNFDDFVSEDLDDFIESNNAIYEVWLIGYDDADAESSINIRLESFGDPDKAVTFASSYKLSDKIQLPAAVGNIKYFLVEIETVVEVDGDLISTGTIYRRTIPNIAETPDITVTSKDYLVLEDGNLKISCNLLPEFSENDCISIKFAEEQSIIKYNIISKVNNAFICEILL